jgi:hypothetical protein
MPAVDRRLVRVFIRLAIVVLLSGFWAASADAARKPTKPEFRRLARAVKNGPDDGFYCAERRGARISTRRPRWAAVMAQSNCGLGSLHARFVLRRKHGRWRVRERYYEQGGTGKGVPRCASKRVPRDIRCAPRRSAKRVATAARRVVIGSRRFAPDGYGWGTSRPRGLYNGGVPSGKIFKIHWRTWGGRRARGRGWTYGYRPRGGYYNRPVRIKLRAYHRGRCAGDGPLAYRRLRVKVQKRPGGNYGRWFLWSGARTLCHYF